MRKPERLTVVESTTLHTARFIGVQERRLRRSDGAECTRIVVTHPGAVAILPIEPEGRVVLLRQYRPATEEILYEIPAGTCEPDEPLEVTARRELEEEAGRVAGRLDRLDGFFTAPGFCAEFVQLFVARDLRPTPPRPEPWEAFEILTPTLDEALALAQAGTIRDAKTLVALYRWRCAPLP